MRDKYLTTWTSQGGTTRRQIDYIMINAKYRNADKKAHRNFYCRARMSQNQQRRVQTTQLFYNAAKKYKTPTPPGTGGERKYDIRELRIRPENLTKWYKEQEGENEKGETGREHDQEQTKQD